MGVPRGSISSPESRYESPKCSPSNGMWSVQVGVPFWDVFFKEMCTDALIGLHMLGLQLSL